ncbi:Ribosomal RNA small subunit methyltransferase J [Serratia symbiotica]|nr:Ribosomal RNA small subunit methyltransferase J [Serratia symbiotica]
MKVYLSTEIGINPKLLLILAKRWKLIFDKSSNIELSLTKRRLELYKRDEPKLGAIYVNFISGTLAYRRRLCTIHNEVIAKAVGINKKITPYVVDATGGLGRDAFILAALGCKVKIIERHAILAALLHDGLQRGYQNIEIGSWLRNRMKLIYADSIKLLVNLTPKPDVIYLDPMYPNKPKSALVKKEMQILKKIVTINNDEIELLTLSRKLATQRVVVKRPNYAKPLGNISPNFTILTKNHHFDIYTPIYSLLH